MLMNPDTNQYYFIRFPNFYGIYIHWGLCFQAHTDYLYIMTEKQKRSAIRLGRNGIVQKVPGYGGVAQVYNNKQMV